MKRIHIISPSGSIDKTLINGAAERMKLWGYTVTIAPHAYDQDGRFAGTAANRITDINNALADTNNDIILCSRGGYGLQQIADKIHVPDSLPNNTKRPLLVGFSDITILHNILALKQIPTLHASMCKYVATLPDDDPALHLLRLALSGEKMRYDIPIHPLQRIGKVTGKLIGGNLSVLYGLQATPYAIHRIIDQQTVPTILFIEEIAEHHYHIDRMMQNLKMSGVLQRLGGLVVGQMTDCDDDTSMGCSVLQTIQRAVAEYDYPVLFNFPAGHIPQNKPLRLNTTWTLNVTTQQNILTQEQ